MCIYVHHVHACCLWKPEESGGSPGIKITDGCELQCGCWKLLLSLLHEEQMVLAVEASL